MEKIDFNDYQLKMMIDLVNQEIHHLSKIPFHFRVKLANLKEISKKLEEYIA